MQQNYKIAQIDLGSLNANQILEVAPTASWPTVQENCERQTVQLREALIKKKTVKKGDIVRSGRRGVNPSSFFKPKFTRFSNHSEMDFWHHNMSLKSLRNGLLTPQYGQIWTKYGPNMDFWHHNMAKYGQIWTKYGLLTPQYGQIWTIDTTIWPNIDQIWTK